MICDKLSKTIGIFKKVSKYIPENNLINLYYTFAYPYLIYCNLVWGGCAQTHLNKLLLLQKKLTRLITNSSPMAHTSPLFKRTGILKITDIHTYQLAIRAHKTNKTTGFVYPTHDYQTRSRNVAVPSTHRLYTSQKSINYSLPLAWNNIPNEIRELNSTKKFKIYLKNT